MWIIFYNLIASSHEEEGDGFDLLGQQQDLATVIWTITPKTVSFISQ